MHKEIKRLENCLKTMKRCLKIPHVENCICFSDAFKVLNIEVNKLSPKSVSLKKEIEEITKIISKGNKECLGCNPCIASAVFRAYPDTLDNLYIDNKI